MGSHYINVLIIITIVCLKGATQVCLGRALMCALKNLRYKKCE